MTYQCTHCFQTFSTPYALKRHISSKHQYITKDEGEASRSNKPYEEPDLWDDNLPTDEHLWDDDLSMEQYEENVQMIEQPVETQEINSRESKKSNETDEETDKEIDDNLTFPLSIDPEDFHGTTLDDAINDKMHPPNTEWPNDIYREFMEIVMEYQLSNSCGDRLIKLINNSHNSDENLLPINTKEGWKFLDFNEFPYMKFKTVSITNFEGRDYNFYYQLIIHGIKVLLLQSDINEEFVLKYRNTSIRTYGEQFESDWWNIMESKIPIDNYLLSIILYADSTTCDHLGKTSEHPIYISLGNIPSWQRNKLNFKVLVSYLPKLKVKDNTMKNSESFQKLQRQVFQRCLQILLSPILN